MVLGVAIYTKGLVVFELPVWVRILPSSDVGIIHFIITTEYFWSNDGTLKKCVGTQFPTDSTLVS